MDDPGLLLSTVATASAALVAIVGGLLVSRVVSLATERSGLLHRRDDLASQLAGARRRLAELEDRRLRWDADDILAPYHENMADPNAEVPTLDRMIAAQEVDRTVEEIRPFYDEALEALEAARAMFEPLFKDGRPDFKFRDVVRAGVPIPAGKRELYEAMFDQLLQEHPKPRNPYGLDFDYDMLAGIGPGGPTFPIAATQELNLDRDLEDTRHQVAMLLAQVEQAELALARVSSPKGVTGGVWVLGYFGAVGTLLPLTLMVALTTLPTWLRWTVIGLFASGGAALLTYVVWQVRHLSEGGSVGPTTTA